MNSEIIDEYVVKKGDTLGKIANKYYGVSGPWYWQLIKSANKDLIKNIHLIYPGQVFKIPALPKNNNLFYIQELLISKKQIILYGPPGTGKTYYTKIIATRILT